MKEQEDTMKRPTVILSLLGSLLTVNMLLLLNEEPQPAVAAQEPATEIRFAPDVVGKTTATGSIEPMSTQSLVFEQSGIVNQIWIKPGDQVNKDTVLVTLSSDEQERDLNRLRIELEITNNELAKLQQGSLPEDITIAQAELTAAEQNLAKVQAGATAEELASAQAMLTAAQSKYNDLFKGPSSASIAAGKAIWDKAVAERDTAQHAYNRVKHDPDLCYGGCSQEGENLWKATAAYDEAVANYNKLFEPAAAGAKQGALAEVQKAENDLKLLQQKPMPAELAEAQSRVTSAQQRLIKLQAGSSPFDIQAAQLRVKKAELDLNNMLIKLNKTRVTAPFDGTVLEVKSVVGDRVSEGALVVTMADLTQLKLTAKVPQADFYKVRPEQVLTITVDALNDQPVAGVVKNLAPVGKTMDGVNSYLVDIHLTGMLPEELRPGMTGLATLTDPNLSEESWLVPQNAILQDGKVQMVRRMQGETMHAIPVAVGEAHGEWVVVHSAELHKGDWVVGSVTSQRQQDTEELVNNLGQ